MITPPVSYTNDASDKLGYILIAFVITIIVALILARIITAKIKLKRYNDFYKTGNEETTETNCPKKTHGFLIVLVTEVIAIGLFALGVHLFAKREATNKDVDLDCSANFATVGVECSLKPLEDIDDLDVKFFFYDNNHSKIYEITKGIGNVKKGNTYACTISLFEIKSSKIPVYCSAEVANGTIQLLF